MMDKEQQRYEERDHFVKGDRVLVTRQFAGVVQSAFSHDRGKMYRVEYIDRDGQRSSACFAAYELLLEIK